ncbi:MAG: methionine adenosyltransferase [Defluviitaleaceae bacterium]|nr:methionine adenosyltransferase [Defluviitaleaceae bacterium]
MRKIFTSESVTEGHPDKICDAISDAVLDAMLKDDPDSRVACDTLVTTGLVVVAGEVRTKSYVDIESIVRKTIKKIGYDDADTGFDYQSCGVLIAIKPQSPDIAQGVDSALEVRDSKEEDLGAGDQGMMYGFACTETEELMPLPISLAHRLTRQLAVLRKSGELPYLRPDGKAQVTIEYNDGKPIAVKTVVVSTQHKNEIEQLQIETDIKKHVIEAVIPANLLQNTKYFVNPTGRFVIGGPQGDCGLTGRKIIVDTYGGYVRHGGGAFSGKDGTKVDRSASYMARYIAKNIVAAKLATRCEVELAYAIGVANPLSVSVRTEGTGKISDEKLEKAVLAVFDMRPWAIIKHLGLKAPIFRQTSAYGHFGRPDIDLPWERTDMIDKLLAVTK